MPVLHPSEASVRRADAYLRGLTTDRLIRVLDLITMSPNGDAGIPAMAIAIEAELERREIVRVNPEDYK